MGARKVLIRSKAKFAKPAEYIAEPELAATEPRPAEPEQRREPWLSEGTIVAVAIGTVVLLALAGAFAFHAHAQQVYVGRPPAVIVAPPVLFGQPPVIYDDQWHREHDRDRHREIEHDRRFDGHRES